MLFVIKLLLFFLFRSLTTHGDFNFLAIFKVIVNAQARHKVFQLLLCIVSGFEVVPRFFVRTFKVLCMGVIHRHELYLRNAKTI